MKILFILSILLFVFTGYSQQRLKEYTALNEINYKVGDTVRLGLGSGAQGSFVYLQLGGWMAGSTIQSIPSSYSNLNLVIKKIKKGSLNGIAKVWFVVDGGNITNYNLFIDEAIQVCEVLPCLENPVTVVEDKFEKLKKLKELFDMGVLTEDEYNSEKKKLLDN